MLKGRGKSFAPKKVVRKPQGSAPSSTRPSVDRSSQTPAPQTQTTQENAPSISQKVIDLDPVVEEVAPHIPVARQPVPQQNVQQQADTAVTQDGENHVRSELKRKERDHAIAPPPPKRVSTAIEKPTPTPQDDSPVAVNRIQETSSSTEPVTTAVSDSPSVPAAPITNDTPVAYVEAITKPAKAQPKVVSPKLKRNVGDNPKVSRATVASPPSGREEESIGDTATPKDADQHNLQQTTVQNPNGNTSIPTPPASSASSAPNEQRPSETVIPDIPVETTEEDLQTSPPPERSPEPPRHRYPSPQNIVRLADEARTGPSNMGRAGGMGIEVGSGNLILRPGEVTQASAIVPVGALNPDGTSGAIQVEEPASAAESATTKGTGKPKRKYTKRKKVQPPGDGEDARTTVGMQLNRPRRVAGAKKKGRKRKDGTKTTKQRAATPDGASDEEIDQSTLTMTDLCRDLRIGKKFSRHQEIKERVAQNKERNLQNKMIMNNPEIDGLVGPAPNGAPAGDAAASATAAATASGSGAAAPAPVPEKEPSPEVSAEAGQGPQIRIIDGQLVIDESSLQIDRQARARLMAEEMEEVIEDDFTRVITSGTYMKREKSMLWDHAATVRFYEGLAQFGTDFEMIAKLFPHRNRRQIKLKFNKEERAHPERVTKAMVGPKKKGIDLKNFERLADEKLVDVSVIEAEYDEYENEMLAKEKVELDAIAEINRQKKAAIQGTSAAARKLLATMSDDEDEPRAGSAKENRGKSQSEQPKRRPQKKTAKKNKHSHYAGGEEVTVLGTIDY